MHKLNRPTEPTGLIQKRRIYKGIPPQKQAWKEFDKDEVREQLKTAQSGLCAYCEVALNSKTNIDHFEPKHRHYSLTFDWDNLVLSCNEKGSCDNRKGGKFEPYWINPYATDPIGMFTFYSNGQIEGTSTDAQKMIKDFGLDCPRLEGKRQGILHTLQETILLLMDFPDALEAYLESEEAIMFPTAYKQIINKTIGA